MNTLENQNYTVHQPEATVPELEEIAKGQWETGAKLEAMETVLGHYINATDLQVNPTLSAIFMINDPAEAVAGLLLLKQPSEESTETDTVVEVEAAPDVYEVYDKKTGELLDIGGGEGE